MKKILIVSSSLRKGSNSELLAHRIAEGAVSVGNLITELSLKEKDLCFCVGCLACQNTGTCVIRDDMDSMIDLVKNADVLVFATPVYYYGISGQLKTFLDRCNPLYVAEYKFREVYLVTASTECGDEVHQIAQAGIQGWVDCFPKAAFCKTLSGGGLSNPNEASFNNTLLQQAYEMGKNM